MTTNRLASLVSPGASLHPSLRGRSAPLRRSLLGALALLGVTLVSACGSNSSSGPTQYMDMTYSLNPPGVTTGNTALKLAVVTEALMCQRGERKIQVSANGGEAGITITLLGAGTNPQAALRADKDTTTVAEVALKLPQTFDARTLETGNPITYLTSDRTMGLSCTLTISGPDPFASFDGSLGCSTLTGSARDVQLNAQFHATPCP